MCSILNLFSWKPDYNMRTDYGFHLFHRILFFSMYTSYKWSLRFINISFFSIIMNIMFFQISDYTCLLLLCRKEVAFLYFCYILSHSCINLLVPRGCYFCWFMGIFYTDNDRILIKILLFHSFQSIFHLSILIEFFSICPS